VRARDASSYLRTRGRWCPRRTCPGTSPRGSIAWEKECGCVGDTVSGGRKEEPRDGGRSRRMEISDGDMGGRGRLTLGTPGGRWSARPCTSKAWATGIPQRRSPRTCSPSRCGTRASGSRAPRRRSWSAFWRLSRVRPDRPRAFLLSRGFARRRYVRGERRRFGAVVQKRVDGVQHGVSLHPRRSCLKSKVQTRGDISGRERLSVKKVAADQKSAGHWRRLSKKRQFALLPHPARLDCTRSGDECTVNVHRR